MTTSLMTFTLFDNLLMILSDASFQANMSSREWPVDAPLNPHRALIQ